MTLGTADSLGDAEARDWARKQMALDYVRSAEAKKSSQAAPKMQEAS